MSVKHLPGGFFGGLNLFIALTWNYRENIEDFTAAVAECAQEWRRLFGPITPFDGRSLDDYINNYSVAGRA